MVNLVSHQERRCDGVRERDKIVAMSAVLVGQEVAIRDLMHLRPDYTWDVEP